MELQKLDELVADAMSTMQKLAGGMAVCTFTRARKPVPAVKYAEGRWAALRQVRRTGQAQAVLVEWDSALQQLTAQGASSDWIAYRTGGVDAVREALESCADSAPRDQN